MELKILKCPVCGATVDADKIDFSKHVAKCPSCDETFIIEQAERFAKVEVDKSKDIANFRRNLGAAAEKDDAAEIKRLSANILDILPDDYEAGYYYAYAANRLGDGRYLYEFYRDEKKQYTEEAASRVVEHVIEHGELRDNGLIEEFVRRLGGKFSNYLSIYQDLFEEKIKQEELFDDVMRDVFICHSSKNADVAKRLLYELESDGNKCWASFRNLRPNDNENYWDNIYKAINSCRIFLVVSSRDSMFSTDVKKEIGKAKELNKKRIEIKIDDTAHTAYFKEFFDGCKWVQGENYREIKERVADLLLKELSGDGNVVIRKAEKVKFTPIKKADVVESAVIGELHEHSFEKAGVIESTCKEKGYTVYRCSCGQEKKTDYTPKRTEHDFRLVERKEPTCTKDGYAKYECAYCDETKTEVLPAKGHDFRLAETKEPTCIEEGHNIYKCSVCGESKPEIIPEIEHTYGDWIITKNPTCEEIGEKARQCSFCGHTETRSVPAEGHEYSEWQTLPDGITQERICRKCGHSENRSTEEYRKEQEKILEEKRKEEEKKYSEQLKLNNTILKTTCALSIAFFIGSIIFLATSSNSLTLQNTKILFLLPFIISIVFLIPTHVFIANNKKTGEMVTKTQVKNSSLEIIALIFVYIFMITTAIWGMSRFFKKTFTIQGVNYSLYKDSLIVTGCNDVSSIIIPDEIDGILVTSIGSCAFKEYSNLKSVKIGNNISSIGSCAFDGCSGLTSVTISDSVTKIDDYAFSGCSGLIELYIGSGVTDMGKSAFSSCENLKNVIISEGVTIIGDGAFNYCRNLENITIPNSIKIIKRAAFWYCESLTYITIPDSVEIIGERAFFWCRSLTYITIPDRETCSWGIMKINQNQINTSAMTASSF